MNHVSRRDAVSDLLTLVITTSPTPSAPSTELLSSVLESFQAHCPALLQCSVIVVFDTYEQITAIPRLKKGYVTPETATKYSIYKDNVKTLFLDTFAKTADEPTPPLLETSGEAEYGSPQLTQPVPLIITSTDDKRVRFIEADGRRLGFGLAVRTALRVVSTPYVWVHQHDWRLIHEIPIAALLGAMQVSSHKASAADCPPIRYVCLPSGRRSSYATSEQVVPYPALRQVSLALTGEYPSSATTTRDGHPLPPVPLTPLFFWHDKPHVAATAHYLARVFPSRLAMSRGAFIEDTVGQAARNQMKAGGWRAWATWLYYPGVGESACLRHLHGRTWRGEEEEERRRQVAVLRGREDRPELLRERERRRAGGGEDSSSSHEDGFSEYGEASMWDLDTASVL